MRSATPNLLPRHRLLALAKCVLADLLDSAIYLADEVAGDKIWTTGWALPATSINMYASQASAAFPKPTTWGRG